MRTRVDPARPQNASRRRTRGARLAWTLNLALIVTTLGSAGAVAAEPNDLARHPFAASAPANTRMGTSATFESATDSKTAALAGTKPVINSTAWSIAVAIAAESDPNAKVTNLKSGAVTYFRVPSGAQVSAGTDKNMTVIQPDGFTAYDCYKMTRVSPTEWTSTYIVKTDLRGDGVSGGVRAAGVSQLMGLIRAEEVASRNIPHALALALPDALLTSGPIWPARTQDSNAATAYRGLIPMGTMLALPPQVDLGSLGLSADGVALGRALQSYGAYVLERAGTAALYADPLSDAAGVERLRAAWRTLYPLLRVVANSSAAQPVTGGAPGPAAGGAAPSPAVTGRTGAVTQSLYQDILGRAADSGGLAAWSSAQGSGSSVAQVAASLATSSEYANSTVVRDYEAVLGRDPDLSGMKTWSDALMRGAVRSENLQVMLYSSAEYYAMSGGTTEAYVAALYRGILRREAGPSEIAGWTGAVHTLGTYAVAQGFWGSDESATQRVQQAYQQFLGRSADPSGLATWPTVLIVRGEGELRGQLVGSAEYGNRAVARFP